MRGEDQNQQAMFSYVSPEARVPKDHPLRPIRIMVDNVLNNLAPLFREMYSHTGRPSIPPEQLLRASCYKCSIPSVVKGCWSSNWITTCCFVGSSGCPWTTRFGTTPPSPRTGSD